VKPVSQFPPPQDPALKEKIAENEKLKAELKKANEENEALKKQAASASAAPS